MLIETDVGIDLTGESLLGEAIGDTWRAFTKSLTPEQNDLLNYGANLVFISLPESDLGTMVNEIIVDETLPCTNKIMVIRNIIRDNLLEIAAKLGFVLDGDYASDDDYYIELIRLIDFVYEADKLEDVSGMCSLLESQDIDPKERYIGCLKKHYGEEFETDKLNYLITDVSETALEYVRAGLLNTEDEDIPLPEYIKNRVIANKELIRNTLGWDHVVNNGQLGLGIESLVNFFRLEMEACMNDSWLVYAKNLASLYLISDINSANIKEQLLQRLKDYAEDIISYSELEQMIKDIQL